jgi:hypothetical protein
MVKDAKLAADIHAALADASEPSAIAATTRATRECFMVVFIGLDFVFGWLNFYFFFEKPAPHDMASASEHSLRNSPSLANTRPGGGSTSQPQPANVRGTELHGATGMG